MTIKKKTIFKLFIVPLILVMVVQSMISYGTFFFSGTPFLLKEYSVGILNQTVENRRILLENNMVQRWSDLEEEVSVANSTMERIVQNRERTPEKFLRSNSMQKEFLQAMVDTCLSVMRKNTVTGSFLILANDQVGGDDTVCQGIYFRDSDPEGTPPDYSDILLERGSSSFSHEKGIPFDTLWTTDFHFGESGAEPWDNFFYKPYEAAKLYPDTKFTNLAYWSEPFVMEGNSRSDSYRMITYSVPLIYEGTVYGVMGVEISTKYMAELLPVRELSSKNQGSYMLAKYTEDGTLLPLVVTGTAALEEEALTAEKTRYDSLYGIKVRGKDAYANISRLHLYNTNTPFAEETWVVAGIEGKDTLFGIGDKIIWNLLIAILVGLGFGVVAIYVIVSNLTKPIRRLVECIRDSRENKLSGYQMSDITEVDELYEVVRELTNKQQEAEYSLMEEKERYRIALQSSTDILYAYDVRQGSLDVYNVDGKEEVDNGESTIECHYTREDLLRMEKEVVHEDDRELVREALKGQGEINLVFQARLGEQDKGYSWVEMTGKVIYDSNRERSKIIGSIKNIHEKKIRELMELDTVRRDPVTGLYKRNIGEKLITAQIEEGNTGSLLLLDMDKFRDLDEKYGIVFGDAILEQIGAMVMDMKHRLIGEGRLVPLAVREGGDEILVWLENGNRTDAEDFLRELRDGLARLFPDSEFCLQLSSGVAEIKEGEGFADLLDRAEWALAYAKITRDGATAFYEDLSREQLERARRKPEIDEIVSVTYQRGIPMVPLVFNFFDKSNDVAGILSVLLVKLGTHYGLSDIVISRAEPEYHTVHPEYQWHTNPESRIEGRVHYFNAEEYERYAAGLNEGYRIVGSEEQNDRAGEFYMLPAGAGCFVVPMYDNGEYAGCIVYGTAEEKSTFREEISREFVEISKIIESNINREKYDLASRAKSDFLSRMSHEIRTPMNAIIGMTGIAMREKEEPDKVEDCLKKIDRSSQYLLSLINDILDMSKIESGKMKLEIGSFSMKELADGIANLIEPQAQAKGISFKQELDIPEEWVIGDSLRLNQVLINLLGNAVKFTPEGGCVTLKMLQKSLPGGGINTLFSVKDTGIGVSGEDKQRIFRSFEQADDNTSRQYGGTGLGLAISERLVRMMGGLIELDSEEGEGSEFYFSLRQEKGTMPENRANGEVKEEKTKLEGKRVLLVEDNELNLEIARTVLEMQKCLVDSVVNGQEAVDTFRESEEDYYDLILMDIRMPVMDGLEATRLIRALNRPDARTVPIVAMSANAFEEDMKKSLESGMNAHLAKPFQVEALVETLHTIMKEKGAS